MTQQQTVSFLHDSGGRLAVQHGTFALMRLEFVVGQFLFPALVVPHDQVYRRMLPLIEQRCQEAMRLGGPLEICDVDRVGHLSRVGRDRYLKTVS